MVGADGLSLGASALVAHVGTNLDNFLALMALLPGLGRLRAVTAFVSAQALVLSLAWGFAEGVEHIIGGAVGWLGLVPLGLGLYGVWGMMRASDAEASVRTKSPPNLIAAVLMFLAMSGDTLAVFVPFLADTSEVLEHWVLLGAGLSVVILAGVSLGLWRGMSRISAAARWLEAALPWIMIAVGLYVIWNTATD